MEDAMENRTKPSPSPLPLPRGEGEPANASSRLGECRLRSHAPKLGATAARPSPTRPNALAHPALPDEPSGSPSPLGLPWGEGGVRGKGLACRLRLSFQPVARVSIPPKIARNQLEYPLWMMRKPPVPCGTTRIGGGWSAPLGRG